MQSFPERTIVEQQPPMQPQPQVDKQAQKPQEAEKPILSKESSDLFRSMYTGIIGAIKEGREELPDFKAQLKGSSGTTLGEIRKALEKHQADLDTWTEKASTQKLSAAQGSPEMVAKIEKLKQDAERSTRVTEAMFDQLMKAEDERAAEAKLLMPGPKDKPRVVISDDELLPEIRAARAAAFEEKQAEIDQRAIERGLISKEDIAKIKERGVSPMTRTPEAIKADIEAATAAIGPQTEPEMPWPSTSPVTEEATKVLSPQEMLAAVGAPATELPAAQAKPIASFDIGAISPAAEASSPTGEVKINIQPPVESSASFSKEDEAWLASHPKEISEAPEVIERPGVVRSIYEMALAKGVPVPLTAEATGPQPKPVEASFSAEDQAFFDSIPQASSEELSEEELASVKHPGIFKELALMAFGRGDKEKTPVQKQEEMETAKTIEEFKVTLAKLPASVSKAARNRLSRWAKALGSLTDATKTKEMPQQPGV